MAHRNSGTQPLTEPDGSFCCGMCVKPGSLCNPFGDIHPLNPLTAPGPADLPTVPHVGSSWDPSLPAQEAVGLIESYTLPSTRLTIGSYPVASGAIADIYEGSLDDRKVCVKRYRCYSRRDPQGAQEVCHAFLHSSLPVLKVAQTFFREALMWARMRHPNIVPLYGVTTTPLQFVSEWMANGSITEYTNKHPGADRLGLVCFIRSA